MKVEQLNKFTEIKQPTSADKYTSSGTMVLQSYGPVTATASQTVINFGFSVPQDGVTPKAFFLLINGQKLPSDDYSFTNIISGQSSQVTLVAPLTGTESIECFLKGTTVTAFPNPSTVQAGLNQLYAGLAAYGNVFTVPATTNTTYANSGTLDSNGNPINNPYRLFFDDGKPLFGADRFMIGGIQAITDTSDTPYDSAGLQGYYLVNARTGLIDRKFRCYGNWSIYQNTATGPLMLTSSTVGDYFAISGIYNKINMLFDGQATRGSFYIYLDGVNTSNTISHVTSSVNNSQNYQQNCNSVINIGTVAQGIHTTKLIMVSTTGTYTTGFEVINDQYSSSANITVPACSKVIQGQVINFPAYTGANSLPYVGSTNNNGQAYTGSRGARVAWYPTTLGTYTSKVQSIVETIQTGTLVAGSSSADYISGISNVAAYYNNSQGNIVRVRGDSSLTATNRMLLVPTADGSNLTFGNDFTGTTKNQVMTANSSGSNIQYRDDGTTACTFSAGTVYLDLYGKCLGNADHSNEEPVRDIHWRDLGYGASTDFSTLGSSIRNAYATLDDDTTNLVGSGQIAAHSDGGVGTANTGDLLVFTFNGSGIDYVLASGLVRKIVSDLPNGSHTLKLLETGGSTITWAIDGVTIGSLSAGDLYSIGLLYFKVYQPKLPLLAGYSNPEFVYNVIANQVQTNLTAASTVGFGSYTDSPCIDQGVIRKFGFREYIYDTGWSQFAQSASLPGGSRIGPPSAATGGFNLNIYGVSKFRVWGYPTAASDTYAMIVDGVTLGSWTSPANNITSICTSYMNIATLGSHTIRVNKSGTNGNYGHACIDYNTPIYEPAIWNTNPYLDYFISGTGVGDKRQISLLPMNSVAREYTVLSTVASSTTITTSGLLLSTMVLDKGKWNISAISISGNSNYATAYISIDGTPIFSNVISTISEATIPLSTEITLTKRAAITYWIVVSSSTGIYYSTGTVSGYPCQATIIARKISN